MKFRRMPIEVEAPEGMGYDNIDYNLSESSFMDQRLSDLGFNPDHVVLCYGDHLGKQQLRDAIALDAGMHPEQVLITAGAAAALFIVAASLVERGDHMVVARCNYATNIETPGLLGADISFIDLKFEREFRLDLSELDALITDKTRLVSLTYPHNPTGAMLSLPELQAVIELTGRKGCKLLLDETYREMSFAGPLPVAASLADHVISISSMSKAYGLPGIRIGWILCGDKDLFETFLAAKEQIFITNSVLDEEVALHYLARKRQLFPGVQTVIRQNFDILRGFMQTQEVLEWVEPRGGCVAFIRFRPDLLVDTTLFYKLLLEKYSTYVGRGGWFEESDRYMRIGYGWEKTAKLRKGLDQLLLATADARQD